MSKTDRLPPMSLDAEQATLGSLLLDETAITRVMEVVTAGDFFRTSHQAIYKAVVDLHSRGWPTDIVSIVDQLDREDKLTEAGGVAYIHSLPTIVPTAIHCGYYAEIVRRTALKRRLIEMAGRVAAIGYDDALDVEEAITRSEELFARVQHAAQTRTSGVFTVDDLEEDIDKLFEEGWQPGTKTCWPELDPHYSICSGEVTIVHGIPSHGKSSWMDALMVGLAQRNDWRFMVSSPENPPAKHFAKLAEIYTGRPFSKLTMTSEQLAGARNFARDHFNFVLPYEGHRNIKSVLNTMVATGGAGFQGLVLDPWNNFEHDHASDITDTKYISTELTRIKNFVQRQKAHAWVVVHPAGGKLHKKPDGTYPVPSPYDILDSSHWYAKADNIIAVWRDVKANDDHVAINVQKVRFKQNGSPGTVELLWDRHSGQFHSPQEMRA